MELMTYRLSYSSMTPKNWQGDTLALCRIPSDKSLRFVTWGCIIIFTIFGGISFFNITYKVRSDKLRIAWAFIHGSRPAKYITSIQHIRKKRIVRIDFKTVLGIQPASEIQFGISAKLTRLCKLTLSNTKNSVTLRKDLYKRLYTKCFTEC